MLSKNTLIWLKNFAAGRLPEQVYSRLTTFSIMMLPAIIYPPIRYVADKSGNRKKTFFKDELSQWGGLAIFMGLPPLIQKLTRNKITNPALRTLVAMSSAVLARTIYQGVFVARIAERLIKKNSLIHSAIHPNNANDGTPLIHQAKALPNGQVIDTQETQPLFHPVAKTVTAWQTRHPAKRHPHPQIPLTRVGLR